MTDKPKLTIVSSEKDIEAYAAKFREVADRIIEAQNALMNIASATANASVRRFCLSHAQNLNNELAAFQSAQTKGVDADVSNCPF
jgi:hypothetical protein